MQARGTDIDKRRFLTKPVTWRDGVTGVVSVTGDDLNLKSLGYSSGTVFS